MAKKQTKKKTVEKMQTFKMLKQFETDRQIYRIGDIFTHNNKEVINFLKTNKFI